MPKIVDCTLTVYSGICGYNLLIAHRLNFFMLGFFTYSVNFSFSQVLFTIFKGHVVILLKKSLYLFVLFLLVCLYGPIKRWRKSLKCKIFLDYLLLSIICNSHIALYYLFNKQVSLQIRVALFSKWLRIQIRNSLVSC